MLVISPLRPARFSMTSPMASLGISRNSFSIGSSRLPSVVLAINDFGARDQHFVAFAAHLLDQNGDLHFAAAADVENIRRVGLRDAQGDVGADFLDQPLPDMPRGDELAVLPGQRAVVDGELHLNGRRINRHERQRLRASGLSVMVSPMNTSSKPATPMMSPACASGISMRFMPFEMVNGGDFALGLAGRRREGRRRGRRP